MKATYPKRRDAYLLMLAILSCAFLTAQVGINTTDPEGILDIKSPSGKTHGVVLPRVALTATNTVAPVVNPQGGAATVAIGTVVYNTNTTNNGTNDVVPGIYVWTGGEWFNKFTKKQAAFYTQSASVHPNSSDSFTDIPGLDNETFTADFTGTYKIEVSVNYGGGIALDINADTDVSVQDGQFRFQFTGESDELLEAKAYSVQGSTNYYLIWEQFSIVKYVDLVQGDTYTLDLDFDQYDSPEFHNNGNYDSGVGFYSQGTGWIGFDIPCSVEIIYLGE